MFFIELDRCLQPKSHRNHGADGIIMGLNQGNLTEEEQLLAWEGYSELKRDGYIMQDPNQKHSDMFNVFTTAGKKYLEELKQKDLDFSTPKGELNDAVTDTRLINSCKLAFDNEDYWNAVSNAQRHLEIRVKEKSGLNITGFNLMSTVFSTARPILTIRAADHEEEKEGFKHIMMGMMKFHRNQKAHNEGTLTRQTAMQIIGYIDYLLKIVEQSEIQTPEN
ncbi:TIGR02391 family protein [Candidatus Woesearchaeota archaeon]|nr:TIGR02391 family protein [Candidatus Woesearchaeota archaeon]